MTHDLLFTFPFLFRPLSFVSPFALCTPFFGAECVIFAASVCIFAISPFCFQFVCVRSCSCLTHELDLSALDVCRVGKAELPNYLWDQGPVIEFLTYGNSLVPKPGTDGGDRQNEFGLIGAARYRWRR